MVTKTIHAKIVDIIWLIHPDYILVIKGEVIS